MSYPHDTMTNYLYDYPLIRITLSEYCIILYYIVFLLVHIYIPHLIIILSGLFSVPAFGDFRVLVYHIDVTRPSSDWDKPRGRSGWIGVKAYPSQSRAEESETFHSYGIEYYLQFWINW